MSDHYVDMMNPKDKKVMSLDLEFIDDATDELIADLSAAKEDNRQNIVDNGNPYTKIIKERVTGTEISVDIYDVLVAFNVTNPATAHAVKKILCAGTRGTKSKEQDILEAIRSLQIAMIL